MGAIKSYGQREVDQGVERISCWCLIFIGSLSPPFYPVADPKINQRGAELSLNSSNVALQNQTT